MDDATGVAAKAAGAMDDAVGAAAKAAGAMDDAVGVAAKTADIMGDAAVTAQTAKKTGKLGSAIDRALTSNLAKKAANKADDFVREIRNLLNPPELKPALASGAWDDAGEVGFFTKHYNNRVEKNTPLLSNSGVNIQKAEIVGDAVDGTGDLGEIVKGGSGALDNVDDVRYRVGEPISPIEKTLDHYLNPEGYAYEVAEKYGINLKGSGQKITIKYNPELASAGKSRKLTPTVIEVGPQAFVSEEELANTIAHELNHARDWLKGGNAPDWPTQTHHGAYSAGDALAEYIRGER